MELLAYKWNIGHVDAKLLSRSVTLVIFLDLLDKYIQAEQEKYQEISF